MVQKSENKISVNKFHSYNYKSLSKGCQQCVRGRKTVLYITGICPRQCFYCPLSEQKKDLDVMYVNERKVSTIKEIIEECVLSGSTGVGITGGDPLAKLSRTIKTIISLKKKFGTAFHIHLYTSLDLLTETILHELFIAGLDEIRVHPDLDDEKFWSKIKLLKTQKWSYGIEIPAIPKKLRQTKKLINYAISFIKFINLNQFEYSDTNQEQLHKQGYFCENEDTYAIGGSDALAKKVMSWSKLTHPSLPVHYCTAKLKDATQIANRFKIRSKNIAKPFDVVDDEGMLIRGVIDSSDSRNVSKIRKNYDIPMDLIQFDSEREQILIAGWILQEIYSDLPFDCTIVTEYPTYDRMIVEVLPLNK